jgi:hypothetical protein
MISFENNGAHFPSQWTCLPYFHSVAQISYQPVSNFQLFEQNYSRSLMGFFIKGDLGVQRGLCRWYLSLHSDEHPITVSPEKKKTPAKSKSTKKGKKAVARQVDDEDEDRDDDSDIGARGSGDPAGTVTDIPPPFAPSVTKILKTKPLLQPPPVLPDGLSVASLKSRLSGKKVK